MTDRSSLELIDRAMHNIEQAHHHDEQGRALTAKALREEAVVYAIAALFGHDPPVRGEVATMLLGRE